jgi:hypothetical protein
MSSTVILIFIIRQSQSVTYTVWCSGYVCFSSDYGSNITYRYSHITYLYSNITVSDLRQVGGFLLVLRFPPAIKLTATI